jgi:predicted Zn-dependent protease
LIKQAVMRKHAARTWRWEVHTTSDANQEAISLAGGKLLFGTAYIKALHLEDGELATLMGHEIAHAIAEHQREEVSQVFFLNRASIPITVDTAMA